MAWTAGLASAGRGIDPPPGAVDVAVGGGGRRAREIHPPFGKNSAPIPCAVAQIEQTDLREVPGRGVDERTRRSPGGSVRDDRSKTSVAVRSAMAGWRSSGPAPFLRSKPRWSEERPLSSLKRAKPVPAQSMTSWPREGGVSFAKPKAHIRGPSKLTVNTLSAKGAQLRCVIDTAGYR